MYKEKTSYNSSSVDNLLQSLPIPTINEEQKQFCELKISPKECAEALKTFKNNKSPGIDGIPADFYTFFWLTIKMYVTDAINYSFTSGQISTSQKLGVITLIPKKDKDRFFKKLAPHLPTLYRLQDYHKNVSFKTR